MMPQRPFGPSKETPGKKNPYIHINDTYYIHTYSTYIFIIIYDTYHINDCITLSSFCLNSVTLSLSTTSAGNLFHMDGILKLKKLPH